MDESILLKGESCVYEEKVAAEYRAFVAKCHAQYPDLPKSRVKKKPKISRRCVRQRLLRNQKNKCLYCECYLDVRSMTLDHMVPRSKGGTNTFDNLAAACSKCNNKKGDMTKDEFLKSKPLSGCL